MVVIIYQSPFLKTERPYSDTFGRSSPAVSSFPELWDRRAALILTHDYLISQPRRVYG